MTEGRRFHLRGRVQGVFFRESSRTRAIELGLTGHAFNLADGSVEVVAFGSPPALDELALWLAKGPRAARVDHLDSEPLPDQPPATGFQTGWR